MVGPLPDYLWSWFSECSLSSTKLDDSCKKMTQIFFGKFFLNKNFFKFFLDPHIFSAKQILTTKKIHPKKFYPHFFFGLKKSANFFWPPKKCQERFFCANKIVDHKRFRTKKIPAKKNYDQIFHGFGLGIWDLGFRIGDLGFRIWD